VLTIQFIIECYLVYFIIDVSSGLFDYLIDLDFTYFAVDIYH